MDVRVSILQFITKILKYTYTFNMMTVTTNNHIYIPQIHVQIHVQLQVHPQKPQQKGTKVSFKSIQ